jgi:outer membrane receptor for ferric coprogen and ferric-rhodotorulic acid
VRTYVPRNTARASLTWTPAMLPALKLGGAIKYQSNIRRVADATTASGDAILIRQPGYALVDLMARYDITPHWSLSANLNNLTNKKYLTSLYWDQAYYGAPRTASVTIGWKF